MYAGMDNKTGSLVALSVWDLKVKRNQKTRYRQCELPKSEETEGMLKEVSMYMYLCQSNLRTDQYQYNSNKLYHQAETEYF